MALISSGSLTQKSFEYIVMVVECFEYIPSHWRIGLICFFQRVKILKEEFSWDRQSVHRNGHRIRLSLVIFIFVFCILCLFSKIK